MHPPVLAPEQAAGNANETVAAGIVHADARGGGDGGGGADRAADNAGCDIAGRDAACSKKC
jgi:hypothetical protein